MLLVDIVRAGKWTDDLYLALEVIKDGLVDNPRYESCTINIRGCRVAVFTNKYPDLTMLTDDRWRIHDMERIEEYEYQ